MFAKVYEMFKQEKREQLCWKSAFEIYFGRKVNELKNEERNHDKTIHLTKVVGPSKKDFRNQKHNTNQWSKKTREADPRMAEKMMERILTDISIKFTNLVTKFLYMLVPNAVGQQLSILY